ncbi:hypothetical protein NY2A_b335R [Paramecium bursaria Chlorella virus NY2A]|uniref:Uncharacterized protein b335R n=1 Tax=Paramecium bursaria Chlorella virus NY2A TaxID=46021 RepID=A7IWL0_PBCVN|nr:hypothetical protein NY2A_b335R [Paramecium bursaria Chlorella virus NY2A]ABT14734.1 hypothetical protein NY2A_b335R [Paramecium bursaria Chlorella virus NY2A]
MTTVFSQFYQEVWDKCDISVSFRSKANPTLNVEFREIHMVIIGCWCRCIRPRRRKYQNLSSPSIQEFALLLRVFDPTAIRSASVKI